MRRRLNIPVVRLTDTAILPTYAHVGDAGMDLYADEDIMLGSETWNVVSTGVAMSIPEGYVGLIHPRSGLAAKHGITVLNAPGTIDAGYRGEIKVILLNGTDKDFVVRRGDRIAQLVVQEFVHGDIVEVSSLDDTERSTNGFGSTG